MALINWKPQLSVGVKLFDDQHKVLIGMINDLHAALAGGKGNDVMGPILTGLAEYTQTHFAEEEQLLAKHGYPGLAVHKIEHRKLLDQVGALQQKHKSGNTMISVEVMHFLRDWLSTHIQGEDAQYGKFLNARGVQ
ncbi:MAG: bacteriohemerythrin [Anaeromyxobacter sp.]